MTERSSPLSQRVRRLISATTPGPSNASVAYPSPGPPAEPAPLLETPIARLAAAIADLRAFESRREAELRVLRAQLREAENHSQLLSQALAEVDNLLNSAQSLLNSAEERPTEQTLFDRMRARAVTTSRLEQHQREAIGELVLRLSALREQLNMALMNGD